MNIRRIAAFAVCIAVRCGLALVAFLAAKQMNLVYLRALGGLALVPALGFSLIWFFEWRKTGLEVGGRKIWWNHLRPFHAAMYAAFGALALMGYRDAYIALVIDVVVGTISFIHNISSQSEGVLGGGAPYYPYDIR